MKIVLAAICTLGLAGCTNIWGPTVLSKQELVKWHTDHVSKMSNLERFGYRGSDENYHYFITRPIDSFYFPQIPRAELHMPDERPRSQLGKYELYFYPVDPSNNFQKVPDRWNHPDR